MIYGLCIYLFWVNSIFVTEFYKAVIQWGVYFHSKSACNCFIFLSSYIVIAIPLTFVFYLLDTLVYCASQKVMMN